MAQLSSVVYRRQEGVLARRIAGEALLVPISGELAKLRCIFALDPVAEYIWGQIDGRRTLPEILEGVLAAFDVDESQAEGDLRDFVAELRAADLVVVVD